jgi:rhodanese-related sulfurtransferase
MSVRTIEPQELEKFRQEGQPIDLIDVRTPAEYREVHVDFARNVPLDTFDPQAVISARNGAADEPIYVICRSGQRAEMACKKLVASGCDQVVNVAGGTSAWDAAGLPVIRGKKTVSLERQVRIAAGLLVFAGVALGHWVHEAFLILSGFVGLGLVFAGITDTCGMGMLLAKMPWNQVKCTDSTQPTCSR